jgi:hypothetical protein
LWAKIIGGRQRELLAIPKGSMITGVVIRVSAEDVENQSSE